MAYRDVTFTLGLTIRQVFGVQPSKDQVIQDTKGLEFDWLKLISDHLRVT